MATARDRRRSARSACVSDFVVVVVVVVFSGVVVVVVGVAGVFRGDGSGVVRGDGNGVLRGDGVVVAVEPSSTLLSGVGRVVVVVVVVVVADVVSFDLLSSLIDVR
jgi:hypothetical protein